MNSPCLHTLSDTRRTPVGVNQITARTGEEDGGQPCAKMISQAPGPAVPMILTARRSLARRCDRRSARGAITSPDRRPETRAPTARTESIDRSRPTGSNRPRRLTRSNRPMRLTRSMRSRGPSRSIRSTGPSRSNGSRAVSWSTCRTSAIHRLRTWQQHLPLGRDDSSCAEERRRRHGPGGGRVGAGAGLGR